MTTNNALISRSPIDQIIRCNAHELEWWIEEADYRDCSLTRDELEDCAGDCAAANAAAAVFLIYDDAQAYIRAEPADSVSGVCLVEGEPVGTYLADYFDLTPAEAEDVNAFFAKD